MADFGLGVAQNPKSLFSISIQLLKKIGRRFASWQCPNPQSAIRNPK
jgi:hypothetical protein